MNLQHPRIGSVYVSTGRNTNDEALAVGTVNFDAVESLRGKNLLLHLGLMGYRLTDQGRAIASNLEDHLNADDVIGNAHDRRTDSAATTLASPEIEFPDGTSTLERLRQLQEQIAEVERSSSVAEGIIVDVLVLKGLDLAIAGVAMLETGSSAVAEAKALIAKGWERLSAAAQAIDLFRSKLGEIASVATIVSTSILILEKLL